MKGVHSAARAVGSGRSLPLVLLTLPSGQAVATGGRRLGLAWACGICAPGTEGCALVPEGPAAGPVAGRLPGGHRAVGA